MQNTISSVLKRLPSLARAAIVIAIGLVSFPVVAAGETEAEEPFLVGTVLSDSRPPIAIIEVGQEGEQAIYHLHDVINGGELASIRHDGVTLVFADRTIVLSLEGSPNTDGEKPGDAQRVQPPLPKSATGLWLVDRKTVDQLTRGQELTRHTTSLGSEGVLVDEVQKDSAFRELGLKEGDIIRRINGMVPGTVRSTLEDIPQSGADNSMLRLEVERQGQMDVVYFEVSP